MPTVVEEDEWGEVVFPDEIPPAEEPGDEGPSVAEPSVVELEETAEEETGDEEHVISALSEDEILAAVQEVSFQVQEVTRREGIDAYTLLGIKEGAPETEITDAYHYLARLLHPDHFPEGLPEEVADQAAVLFKKIVAAYAELKKALHGPPKPLGAAAVPMNPKATRQSAPAESLDPGDGGRRLFYRAKNLIARGNYWQAVNDLRQVVRMKPKDAESRNLLAFCIMQTGRRLHEAEEHIREAIKLEPGNPDFLTNLGLVYKSGRFFKKAREMFQQALMYDKNHEMARRELRNLSKEEKRHTSSKAFWKKLFGD